MLSSDLELDMQALSSAEDFLDYFGINFEASILNVNRLHILQRFHDYMSSAPLPEEEGERRDFYKDFLQSAYDDFINSDAKTEQVFKVFRRQAPQKVFVQFGDSADKLEVK